MAGLLKQIQKQKRSRREEPQRVVVSTGEIERELPAREGSLLRQSDESDAPFSPSKNATESEQEEQRRLQIVRRGAGNQSKDSSADDDPHWSSAEKVLPERLLGLLERASVELIERIHRGGASVAEHNLKDLISEVAALISDEKFTWKDQEIVQRELAAVVETESVIESLFDDASISDIFIDSHKSIKVIRKGQLIETPLHFRSSSEYLVFLYGLLARSGRSSMTGEPIVECLLPHRGGTRVSVIDPSVLGGEEPRVSIHVPRRQKVSFYDLLQARVLPATLAAWLAEVVVQGEANILIVGTSGSGKTLLTSALLSEIGSDERVTTVEESPELCGSAVNVEQLISRPGDHSGRGEVTVSDLIQVALRRTARRIITSELKHEEARHFLHALEVGFSGSIASVYGEYPEDGLWRLLDSISSFEHAPQVSLMRRISRSFHLVISMAEVEGKPCVSEIVEVIPNINAQFSVLPLIRFEGAKDGKRIWRLVAQESYWQSRVAEKGCSLRVGPGLLPPEPKSKDAKGGSVGVKPGEGASVGEPKRSGM